MIDKEISDSLKSHIQDYRRMVNSYVLSHIERSEPLSNGEDAIRLIGNLNAALEHLANSSDSDSLFCVLKHLSTAMIQATEVFEKSDEVSTMIGILTNNLILPCSSCKEDREKGEYNGIQTA